MPSKSFTLLILLLVFVKISYGQNNKTNGGNNTNVLAARDPRDDSHDDEREENNSRRRCSHDNEFFDSCGGCERTCTHPNPFCTQNCDRHKAGCRCQNGFVRNSNGRCVSPRNCPNNTPNCGRNEIFDRCGGCEATCSNPNPSCPFICNPGACRCMNGFVRHPNGNCVERNQCFNFPTCPRNEFFDRCGGCEATCGQPNPICPRICDVRRAGCRCQNGLVRHPNGNCINREQCFFNQCGANEVFSRCSSGCEGSCRNLRPSCIFENQLCRFQRCECPIFNGFVRDEQGRCIRSDQCPFQNPGCRTVLCSRGRCVMRRPLNCPFCAEQPFCV